MYKFLRVITPVNNKRLSEICNRLSSMDGQKLECKICKEKFPLNKISLHRDYLICDYCSDAKNYTKMKILVEL